MKFHLTIECDNPAFEDDPYAEIGRILAVVAENLADGLTADQQPYPLFDANGNRVGAWEMTA
jgi:hypothetical protein